jgi:hypothetical protein
MKDPILNLLQRCFALCDHISTDPDVSPEIMDAAKDLLPDILDAIQKIPSDDEDGESEDDGDSAL